MVSSVHKLSLPTDKKSARLIEYVDRLSSTIKPSPVRGSNHDNSLAGLGPNCSIEAIREDPLRQGEATSYHQGQESTPETQSADEFGGG
jgi:hypothetical protein